MKNIISLILFMIINSLILYSCKDSTSMQPIAPETSKALYVCNSGASSISVIDLTSGTVTNDVAIVGTWPNQLVYHEKQLYCVNSGSNSISIYDTENWKLDDVLELGAGQNPMNLVIYNQDYLYVSCLLSNMVLQVSRATGAVQKSIPAGIGTTGITSVAGKIYASNTNAVFNGSGVQYGPGSVTVIDGDKGSFLKTIPVGINPQVISLAPDGMIHVLCTGDYEDVFGMIMIIDPLTDIATDSVEIGGTPGGLDATSEAGIGYVSNWGLGLLSYNTDTYTIINGQGNYILGKGGSGLVSDAKGDVYVSVWEENRVLKINGTGEVLATFDVGLNPQALAIKNE